MNFISMRKDIENNKLKPLYILTGSEKTVIGKYLDLIKDCKYVESLANLVPVLKSKGLFSVGNVYVIKNDNTLLMHDAQDLLKMIGKKTTLILIFDKIDKRKKLFKTGKNYIYEFNTLKNAYVYVEQQLGVSTKIARVIADRCGNDIGKIDLEIEKIKLLDPEAISEELVNELITPSPEDRIWDFIDGILKKDAKTVYRIYQDLKILKQDEIHFLGLMYNNFKTVLLIKGMIKRTDYDISKSTGINLWLVGNCRKIVNRYFNKCTMKYVLEYLKAIQSLEVDIKMGTIDPELGFKCLINQFMTT